MPRCRETAGVLFRRPCRADASATCGACGKPICADHGRGEPPECIACLRERIAGAGGRGSLAHLRDDPYFYWYFSRDDWVGDEPFEPEDYALFDDAEAPPLGEAWDRDWDAS